MRFVIMALAAVAMSPAAAADVVSTPSRSGIASRPTVLLTEEDIADRPYHVLGDLKVVVRKQTLFSAEPSRERVDQKLIKAAEKMGADAIILVRYGTVGMGVVGWGELEGRGRAIRFD